MISDMSLSSWPCSFWIIWAFLSYCARKHWSQWMLGLGHSKSTMRLNTTGIQCHLLTLRPQCCFDSATLKSEDSELDQSYHEVSVKYFGGYKLLAGTMQCFHLQFDFLRTSALDPVLQHNDQFCIYIGIYIYTSTEIFSVDTYKSKARFWPRIFWNR